MGMSSSRDTHRQSVANTLYAGLPFFCTLLWRFCARARPMPEPQPVIRAISGKQSAILTNLGLEQSDMNDFSGSEHRE